MAYKIEYFKEGQNIGDTPWEASLDETIKVAEDGLIRHRADFFRIIDVDGSGGEVASGNKEGSLKY